MQSDVEQNFCVTVGTANHSPPKFTKGLIRAMKQLEEHLIQSFVAGRTTSHEVMDALHESVDVVENDFYSRQKNCLPLESENTELGIEISTDDLEV